MKLTTKARK